MAEQPTVGHVMRAFLARTESFVHNQISTLSRHRAVVAAHHRRPVTDYRLGEGLVAEEALPAPLAATQRLIYRAAKVALPPGQAVLARYLREEDARLLHYHYLTDARFLLGVRRRLDLPAIVSGYGYDVSSFPNALHGLGRRYLKPVIAEFDGFLAMSEDMKADMQALGVPVEKVVVHYYGTDTRRFRFPERDYDRRPPLSILCCSRLTRAKGIHLALRALRRIEGAIADGFRMTIVGEGPLRSELERMVGEYGWSDRVTFAGHVPYTSEDLVAFFRGADLFAHPSITVDGLKEGIPGTIVEAMAAGLPVIATRHAGIPAVIDSGVHGLLVEEHDQDGLAGALEALLTDVQLRRRLGTAAAARAAEELELNVRTAALERIYDRFLA
jgi:colanic acid/amylovoran biosynthesis glycosyltransferase